MSDQERSRTEHWGWVERLVIVFALTFLAMVQIMMVSKVFSDVDPETVATFGAAYEAIGLILNFLVLTILGGVAWDIAESSWEKTPAKARVAFSVYWTLGSGYLLYYGFFGTVDFSAAPELAIVPKGVSVALAIFLVTRAIPDSMYSRIGGRLLPGGVSR